MGLDDKLKHLAEDVEGKAKEASGKLRGDTSQESEGKADQSKADFKKAGDNVKDAFKK
ncbi:CsbD family protein [Mumia sp. zg.B53]|uniref:CsbD family protein n=1 Tax=unclassified Mumia TaxID=2621872 RepID=UPI001C6E3A1F|nr:MULTISPECIES: CsbD family protein [unclassified Mumia]MBW9206069.1 CsbD family protein [Mumia sp. zg.B17]MBW9211649.1 CsbD family protein [Mumia sp. zg.B21]MBW9216809.1 CsbD family protein [Mumia sp. zg.B53]MDD9349244.1 CsbD family protein [Mumia sp.]